MKRLIIGLLLSISLASNAQTLQSHGQRFWLGYMENLDLLFNGPPAFAVTVDAVEAGTLTVTAPATGFTFSEAYEVGATEVFFPEGIFYGEGSDVTSNFGWFIESSTEVSLYAMHYRIYFSDASMVLPEVALASSYRVMAVEDAGSQGVSSFVVVATEDATEVAITPSANTLSLFPAGVTQTVELNTGEAHQVQSLGDLCGSMVEALGGEKIAVFGGARQANVACFAGADNHLWDQQLPVRVQDTSFTVVPFATQSDAQLRILATEDQTNVELSDGSAFTLAAGEVYQTQIASPVHVVGGAPLSVALLSNSQDCSGNEGDPSMLAIVPDGAVSYGARFEAPSGFGQNTAMFTTHYLDVVASSVSSLAVTLDGNAVGNLFQPLPGQPGQVYAQIPVSPGEHELLCPIGCQAWTYAFGEYDAYTHQLAFTAPATPLGIDNPRQNAWRVWPNPATSIVSVGLPSGNWNVTVTDAQGRTVHVVPSGQGIVNWSVELWPAGMYVVHFEQEGSRHVERLLIR